MIKGHKFTKISMPDSIIKRVKYWADRDNQKASNSLPFRNRNNEKFYFDNKKEDKLLVEDNASEPVAPFPDILAELPGIELQTDEPVEAINNIAPLTELINEDHICHATANADMDPSIIFGPAEDDMSGLILQNNFYYNNKQHQNNVHNIRNNQQNKVITKEGKIRQEEADKEDEAPILLRNDDSNDEDDDYKQSDQEDVSLDVDDRSELEEEENAPLPEVRRTGREHKRPNYQDDCQCFQAREAWKDAHPKFIEDYQLLQARGKW